MEQYLKDPKSGPSNIPYSGRKMGSSIWAIPHGTGAYKPSNDTSLFSCSLPVLPHENLNSTGSENSSKSTDDSLANLNNLRLEDEVKDPLEDAELDGHGTLLPDEEELLAGIMDDFDLNDLPAQLEDLEDFDLFDSGGGIEMDYDALENLNTVMPNVNLSDGVGINGIGHYAISNGIGAVAGEHPYGEHPSRTLFVRNINSNVEDSELKFLFEQYGDIRTLYTACKHRGFVMISYYDIRAARSAMRALQNKPLRRRKLDIHFSIPKDNPSEKDINQGTLVVFNLDAAVSNEELRNKFGVYGEIKEIRETPHKRHHKFIEFYDVRGAEAALRALNRSDIGGKRIKLEPSRPGGARRNLMQQLGQELDLDEGRSFRHQLGSPLANSPPGNWAQYGSPVECNSLHAVGKFPVMGSLSPISSYMSGLASVLPSHMSNSPKIAPIGKDHANRVFSSSNGSLSGTAYQHSHSFPDKTFGSSPGTISPFGEPKHDSSAIGTLSGPQFLWGSPAPYSESPISSPRPKPAVGQPLSRGQGFAYTYRHGSLVSSLHQHHVGSAPSGVLHPETSFMGPSSFGNTGFGHSNGSYTLNNAGPRSAMHTGFGVPSNVTENGLNYRMMPLRRPTFLGNGSYPIPNEGFDELIRRRVEANGNQIDGKLQFQLDLNKIVNGEDIRTTLMIKNIPNKYTSKMLLAAIDECHGGTYDFLYLPIDFKNKCNVGYAFINMLSPAHIVPFYQAFNGKKWEKFNSEKVASLAYARIQGKNSLVTHFQNSSLMNEDKRCRPILFHSEGQEVTVEETLLSGNLNICIRQPDGSYSGDLLESPKGDFYEKN